MKDNREKWFGLLWQVEGASYTNDARDRGGPSKYGVTIATLSAWRRRECTAADVEGLTLAECCDIASARYWNGLQCDRLPPGIDVLAADFAYHSGVARAAKTLQGLLRGEVDGHIGPKTLDAARRANLNGLLNDYVVARRDYLRSLPGYASYGKGWETRVALMAELAHKLAQEQAAAAPEPTPVAKNTINIQATVAMAGAVMASIPAARDAYEQSLTAVQPLSGLAPWVPPVIGLVVAGLTLFMLARRSRRLADQQ